MFSLIFVPDNGTIIRYIGIQSKKVENFFSKNLQYLRKRENLNLEELSNILGKGKSVVNGYENGKTEPPLSVCYKVVRHFGIDLPHLVEKDLEKAVAAEPRTNYATNELGLTPDQLKRLIDFTEDFDRMIRVAKQLKEKK